MCCLSLAEEKEFTLFECLSRADPIATFFLGTIQCFVGNLHYFLWRVFGSMATGDTNANCNFH